MGDSLDRGMVLVMSLWADTSSNMLWLDSTTPADASASTPGAARGSCPTTGGSSQTLVSQNPTATVTFSNVKWGTIGSTTSSASSTPAPSSTTTAKPPTSTTTTTAKPPSSTTTTTASPPPSSTTTTTTAAASSPSATGDITFSVHQGSNEWWLAVAVGNVNGDVKNVALTDSSSVTSWTNLQSTTWGYWVYETAGTALVAPLNFQITSTSGEVVSVILPQIIAGSEVNTSTQF